MLVDLGRNDLGRVCEIGSVHVPRYADVERYSHVQHLVSEVHGTLAAGRTSLDALAACFPAGTLTGAPKIRAMEIIDELETVRRGVYGGAVGYLDAAGNLDMAIAIRTAIVLSGEYRIQAGAGIVADSIAENEYREAESKAQALFRADRGRPKLGPAMIFLVDNYDSFTFNLVQAVGQFDPDVVVVRNDRFDPAEVVRMRPRAVLISPGPGRPEDAGRSLEMVGAAEEAGLKLLGVCLGHQALAAFHGAVVERAPAPRHGKSSPVRHDGTGLFEGLPSPFPAGRYHSLIVREDSLPGELAVTARTEDGLVMGLAHRSRPVFGVQFHPESVLTPEGERLLANFLAMEARP